MRFLPRQFASFDWFLGLSVFVLVLLGLSAQYGITLGTDGGSFSTFSKQLVALCVGLVGAMVLALWNYRLLQSYAGTLYAVGAVLLGLVLVFGVTRRGTTGWFDVGVVDVQPIEIAKVALVVAVAAILARRKTRRVGWRHIIATGVPVGVYSGLVMWQPDMGSAALMIGAWVMMLVVAGLHRKVFVLMGTVGIVALIAGWFVFFQDFQRDRILTFLNPERDPLGIGYNVAQASIAIGSGRLWGRGLGFGSQSQLQFLPEAQTDFVFAAIAEELGFVGVLLVLGAFALLFWRIYLLALAARDDFSAMLVVGLGATLGLQTLVNIGMNLGWFPVTGLPLPYVSYGGSALVANLLMFGILESIAVRIR